jgi:two-component system, chemotaxis family, protein-glutamate methylesterase/glutaminase
MAPTRVLVVDDSQTVRKRLVEILAGDPQIDVIGEAEDGKQAIEICLRCRPNIITMDMMMPVMSGLSATEYIMAHCPTPILVVSASTNRGELFKIYDALAAGAVDVLEKPLDAEPDSAWERHFLATVKLVARIRVITHPRARLAAFGRPAIEPLRQSLQPPRSGQRYDLVAIGASTGGPGAIATVLRTLPRDFNLPILIVLHLNAPFATAFADWLSSQTERPVVHAEDGAPVAAAAGRAVLAPGDRHLLVRDGRMRLTLDPERHSCRPSVDVLFESVAADYRASAAGCLLTGMGKDGALGLLRIREAGGVTIAQNKETSVVYGMPREAADLGAAQHVLAIGDIGPRLAALQHIAMEACP